VFFTSAPQTWHGTQYQPISAGNFLILVTLLIGLLNFPSMSTSGAELSHAHSLFMLGHHHHDPDGETDFSSDEQTQTSTDASPPSATSTPTGPLLQEPAEEFVGGAPIGLTLAGPLFNSFIPASTSPWWLEVSTPTGRLEEPETPPPRA